MKHKINITREDILNSESWETILHLAGQKGLSVIYKDSDKKEIHIDWTKVETAITYHHPLTRSYIIEWDEWKRVEE